MSAAARAGAVGIGVASLITGAGLRGQTLDVERAATVLSGMPSRGSRTERVDVAQSGRAGDPLPASDLRVTWRGSAGGLLDQPPLVGAGASPYAVTSQGEVVAFAADGTERWREATGIAQPGPAALLVDDTVVFATLSGEAVAVRRSGVRWRVRFARGDAVRPGPLPLPNGGVVVAAAREVVALDADGRERARTSLPEPVSAPLVAALGQVVAVTASGAVWGWVPSAAEPRRLGAFGASVEGGAALVDRSLVAVSNGGTRLVWVDLAGGTKTTRSPPSGALWLGPAATHGVFTQVTLLAPGGELSVSLDASGAELARVLLTPHAPQASGDGGGAIPSGPRAAPLIDAHGTLAFVTADGGVGVVSSSGTLELLADACVAPPETPLAPGRSGGAVAGLAPLRPGEMLVACRSGALLAVAGGKAVPARL
ncbi:MAG TPA: PQQ-binding-like beta-propeller repeat protein [Polyangiaceae bacterium]|nr:PQQ-binding-like beta-propeller repeat protein [Polyangiaceae bacterium]